MSKQKRLDSPELREKLTNLGMFPCIDCGYDCEPPRRRALCPKDVDQILALIPDIDKSSVAITEAYFKGRGDGLVILEANIEEAKREERERILMFLPQIATRFDHNKTCFDCLERIKGQALQGLEEG